MGCGTSKNESKKKGDNAHLIKALQEHEDAVNGICISKDKNTVVTVSEDKTGRLWDTTTEECVGILQGHTSYINTVCVSDRYVFSCSADKTIRKWSLESGACLKTFVGHASPVNRVICAGDLVFSSSYDRTVRCWQSDTGECLRTFTGHKRSVYPLLLIPSETNRGTFIDMESNDDILVSGSVDNTAKSWGLNSNECLVTFKGHTGAVLCLATEDRGKFLFTGSADHTTRSWDPMTGAPIRVFSGHQGAIMAIQVSSPTAACLSRALR